MAVSSNGNEAINTCCARLQEQLDLQRQQCSGGEGRKHHQRTSDMKSLSGCKAQALKEADLPENPDVLGGTMYHPREGGYDGAPFDLLVIDEAGQVSLSNLLYYE